MASADRRRFAYSKLAYDRPKPNGYSGRGFLVPVPRARLVGLEGAVVRVDHRHLPHVPRPAERQLAAGGDVAEQQRRHGVTAARAGVPDLKDRRHVLMYPAQVERTSGHDDGNRRGAGGDDGLQLLQLPSGQVEGVAGRLLADLVLALADHHHRDIGGLRDLDRRGEPRVVVMVGGGVLDHRVHVVEHRLVQPLRDARHRARRRPLRSRPRGSGGRPGW